jgi:Glycoside hydrolase 123, catalytic domain/Glycoside hydrolase 123, N-terminal domain
MQRFLNLLSSFFVVLAMLIPASHLSTGAAAAESAQVEILNNKSQLRAFLVFRTPVVLESSGKLRPAISPVGKNPGPLPDYQSPLPPTAWITTDFDDIAWDRQLAPVEMDKGQATGGRHTARHTATVNSIICLRVKFRVTDPGKVKNLKLALKYVGGALIYLNGKELTRKDIAKGEIKPESLADKYPDDLYCEPKGRFLQEVKMNPSGFQRRYRTIKDLVIPSEKLRKGTNVLAIELHRAPIGEKAIQAKRVRKGGMSRVPGIWAYVGLNEISLKADSNEGLVQNISRPSEIQVWNVAPFETIDSFSFGDSGEKLSPITIYAAGNSVFSGRVAVSSGSAIKNLGASVSDLKTKDGKESMAASAVRVRLAEPAVSARSWTPVERFGGLLDKLPAEIAVTKVVGRAKKRSRSPRKHRTSGAVASLWFTVRVPKKQKAGLYSGTVTVKADGLKATSVPIIVKVSPWQLPDPKDFRIKNMICMSSESIAKHYKVKIWSDKHFKLLEKSMELMAEVNSREVPVNLGSNFYGTLSNEQTLVRWVKEADGKYSYDFTIFDKYLDLVAKKFGKPLPLRMNCWGELGKDGKNRNVKYVTLLDKATGKLSTLVQPTVGTEESYKFWKPVVDKALEKLKARGWLDVSNFGHNSYCYPVKPQVLSIAKRLWPEGTWAYTAHNGVRGKSWKGSKGERMPVMYSSCVWTEGKLIPRGYRVLLAPHKGLWNNASRCRHWDYSPINILRKQPEELIMRGMNGIADFGADNFPIENPKRKGRYFNLGAGRGTGGGNNASTRALLAPGPDGAVASERYEMFREGLQLAEAILYLEKALLSKKISGELATKVEKHLSARSSIFINYWYKYGFVHINSWSAPGQFSSDAELLELAGEVAEAK